MAMAAHVPPTTSSLKATARYYEEEYVWTIKGFGKSFPKPTTTSEDSEYGHPFAPEAGTIHASIIHKDDVILELGNVITADRTLELKICSENCDRNDSETGDLIPGTLLRGRLDISDTFIEKLSSGSQLGTSACLINRRGDVLLELAPPEEVELYNLGFPEVFSNPNQRFKFDLMFLDELWAKSETYFPDDVLRLRITITIFHNETDLAGRRKPKVDPGLPERLAGDMVALLTTGVGGDIQIICGNTQFTAHELILKARSSVFSRMLDSDMIEKQTRIITVEDIDADVFEKLLNYIYSGKTDLCKMSCEMVCKLVGAADKYALVELRDLCCQHLTKTITPQNAGLIATTFYTHTAPKRFTQKVYNFCSKNWRELGRLEVFQREVVKCPQAFLRWGKK